MQRGGRGGGGFRGGGRSFGGGRGGGGRSFGGGGRGGGRGFQDYGPPSEVIEAGIFEHPCEGEAVCKLSIDKVAAFRFAHAFLPFSRCIYNTGGTAQQPSRTRQLLTVVLEYCPKSVLLCRSRISMHPCSCKTKLR